MVTKTKSSGYVVLTYKFGKEGRRWTAYCEELGTATFGRSLPEAKERLKEAVWLHLNTLENVGERERFFREHKITFYETKPKAIKVSLPTNDKVFVQPFIQRIPQYSLS